jgi:two-component system, sensor histidine kinase SagS
VEVARIHGFLIFKYRKQFELSTNGNLSNSVRVTFRSTFVGVPEAGVAKISVAGIAAEDVLNCLPDGVAVIGADFSILWANECFQEWFGGVDRVGENFYSALANPEIVGAGLCPIQTCFSSGRKASTTLHTQKGFYYHIHAAPLASLALEAKSLGRGTPEQDRVVVTLSDVTEEILQEQKLAAIHQAGAKLTDLKPDEIFAMDVEQRIDLLKDNIRHYTRDLLNVEVIEIRLLEQSTGNLIPLLSVGIDQVAADRRLMASPQGQGVTGYVAAYGKSYLCKDTTKDPRYLEAFKGAKSSLTVPIMLHENVIGTINVESPSFDAFTLSDQQFLEIFARDVAVALNTLELLVAQRTNAAQQSCEAIHAAVALPIDDLLLDSVYLMEKYIGHDTETVAKLRSVLAKARSIKKSIQQIGQTLAPADVSPAGNQAEHHSKLVGRRILVVDADEQVRNDAHALLERYGCTVETAHDGDQAVCMVRNCRDEPYDVIISDIKLPDYSGYQLMLRLHQFMEYIPIALMTGFGYDPGHSIVKARQAGLHPKAILYKPFRLDQLLSVTETLIDYRPVPTK